MKYFISFKTSRYTRHWVRITHLKTLDTKTINVFYFILSITRTSKTSIETISYEPAHNIFHTKRLFYVAKLRTMTLPAVLHGYETFSHYRNSECV